MQIKDQMPVTEPDPVAGVEAVVPTACLSQALGTRASTPFERLAIQDRSNSRPVRLFFFPSASICVICGFKKLAPLVTVFTIEDKLTNVFIR